MRVRAVRIHRHNRRIDSDRKSTRLNSSHITISYAVFCLKKKKKKNSNLHSATINKTIKANFYCTYKYSKFNIPEKFLSIYEHTITYSCYIIKYTHTHIP